MSLSSIPPSPSEKCESAAIGIGVLIIFIAMVLVAGIAASVLVQTSEQLEMQALRTGQQTIDEVSSGLKVEAIGGYHLSGFIDKIAIEIAPKSGSPDIDVGNVVLEIADSTAKYVLRYTNNFTNQSDINGDLFGNGDFGDETSFGVIVLQDADESCSQKNPVINYGDHIILAIDSHSLFDGLSPRTEVFGLVICEQGSAGIIGFTSPSSFSEAVISLQ